jgi:hypothetical protein
VPPFSIRALALAVVVAVIVTLGCILLGDILATLKVDVAVTVGHWLRDFASVLGVAAGIWYYFTHA